MFYKSVTGSSGHFKCSFIVKNTHKHFLFISNIKMVYENYGDSCHYCDIRCPQAVLLKIQVPSNATSCQWVSNSKSLQPSLMFSIFFAIV